MRVSIYTIQKTLFDDEAEKVIAYTSQGQITVLKDHLPIISSLRGPGVEIVDKKKERKKIKISSGFLEVRPRSEVVILAE